jgi:hypothetical protein
MNIFFYGCSHTLGYDVVTVDKTWTHHLDIEKSYNPINKGIGGGSWRQVKDSIIRDLPNVNTNDLIIISIPAVVRVYINEFIPEWKSIMDIRARLNEKGDNSNPVLTQIGWVQYMESYENLIKIVSNEVIDFLNMIKFLKVDFKWWSYDNLELVKGEHADSHLNFGNYDCYLDFINSDNSKELIFTNDLHLNQKGHIYQAKLFSNQLNKNEKSI